MILATIQSKGMATAGELADVCEVSVRTIYRDVDALGASGIPIYSERGSSGGYRLLDGYRIRLNGLSAAEAETLLLVGLAQQAADLGLGTTVAATRSKLLSALPADTVRQVEKLRFHLDATAWFDEAEAAPHLPLVASAVRHERPIRMVYQGRKGGSTRRVEPLGLVLKGGIWYLVAQADDGPRTFRVSRMSNVELLDGSFPYPDGFELAAYWAENTKRYEADIHPNRAHLRLSPAGIAMMDEILPSAVRAGIVIAEEADAHGWRRISFSTGSIADATTDVLRFGLEAEVEGPAELRAHVAVVARELASRYAHDPKP